MLKWNLNNPTVCRIVKISSSSTNCNITLGKAFTNNGVILHADTTTFTSIKDWNTSLNIANFKYPVQILSNIN